MMWHRFSNKPKTTRKKPERGFEVVAPWARKFPDRIINLPLVGSPDSAGSDVYSNETVTIQPFEIYSFVLDIKAFMQDGEYAQAHIRSSMGIKGWRGALDVGVIDSGYYSNQTNDGNLMFPIQNMTNEPMTIEAGERIGQIIFCEYKKPQKGIIQKLKKRTGGFGSTNE